MVGNGEVVLCVGLDVVPEGRGALEGSRLVVDEEKEGDSVATLDMYSKTLGLALGECEIMISDGD